MTRDEALNAGIAKTIGIARVDAARRFYDEKFKALQEAKASGDTQRQARAQARLNSANLDLLRAELAEGWDD